MSFFVTATPAIKPKTKNVRIISIGLAAVFVLMAVAQLFTFETFPDVLADIGLPGLTLLWAVVIVTLEVLAVPFLLAMKLSPAMRVVSMVSGWLVVCTWFSISIGANISLSASNSGLLGSTIAIPVGWWSVFFCVALGVLCAWAAWGNWPFVRRRTD